MVSQHFSGIWIIAIIHETSLSRPGRLAMRADAWATTTGAMSAHELIDFRRSRPMKRPINQHPLSASPLNDANLMAGLHAGDRVDTKPTEQGAGVESL